MTANDVAIVTVLVDNVVGQPRLLGEHGLSIALRYGNTLVLFDTGEGEALARNAARLGIDLGEVEHIILSHGHYDHSGGLKVATEAAPKAPVWMHPQAKQARYAKANRDQMESISMPESVIDHLVRSDRDIRVTAYPTVVFSGLRITGTIPRPELFAVDDGLFLDTDASAKDEVDDDQAIFFETKVGLVVLLGCAHSGVINTLSYISRLTKGAQIAAVIGGLHLFAASEEEIRRTVAFLKEQRLDLVVPGHCTGPKATFAFAQAFGSQFRPCHSGLTLSFPL